MLSSDNRLCVWLPWKLYATVTPLLLSHSQVEYQECSVSGRIFDIQKHGNLLAVCSVFVYRSHFILRPFVFIGYTFILFAHLRQAALVCEEALAQASLH